MIEKKSKEILLQIRNQTSQNQMHLIELNENISKMNDNISKTNENMTKMNDNISKINENVLLLIDPQTNTTNEIKSMTKSLCILVQHFVDKENTSN